MILAVDLIETRPLRLREVFAMMIVTQNEYISQCIRFWFRCWEERLPHEKDFYEFIFALYSFLTQTHMILTLLLTKRGGFGGANKQSGGTPSFGGGGSAFGGGGQQQQSGGTPSFGGG